MAILKDGAYEMSRKQFRGILAIAKKGVRMGIYAVERDGITEMKNEPIEDKDELKKTVADYTQNGFKVYYNAE